MEFSVEFYTTKGGTSPILDFLEELKETDPDDHAAVIAGLAKLRNRQYHREPLSKSIDDDLFEMRHVGKLNTRILWFFMKGRRIVAVHSIRNKAWKILPQDRKTAMERKKDWLARYPQ